jgi:hypothetical protein
MHVRGKLAGAALAALAVAACSSTTTVARQPGGSVSTHAAGTPAAQPAQPTTSYNPTAQLVANQLQRLQQPDYPSLTVNEGCTTAGALVFTCVTTGVQVVNGVDASSPQVLGVADVTIPSGWQFGQAFTSFTDLSRLVAKQLEQIEQPQYSYTVNTGCDAKSLDVFTCQVDAGNPADGPGSTVTVTIPLGWQPGHAFTSPRPQDTGTQPSQSTAQLVASQLERGENTSYPGHDLTTSCAAAGTSGPDLVFTCTITNANQLAVVDDVHIPSTWQSGEEFANVVDLSPQVARQLEQVEQPHYPGTLLASCTPQAVTEFTCKESLSNSHELDAPVNTVTVTLPHDWQPGQPFQSVTTNS